MDLATMTGWTWKSGYGASTKVAEITGDITAGADFKALFEAFVQCAFTAGGDGVWTVDIDFNSGKMTKDRHFTSVSEYVSYATDSSFDSESRLDGTFYYEGFVVNYTFVKSQFNIHISGRTISEQTSRDTAAATETTPTVVDITGKTFADVTYDNYTLMAKRDFGIDISEADGWKISFTAWDVSSFCDNGIRVKALYKGDDITGLFRTYYDRCAAVSPDGVWDYNTAYYRPMPFEAEDLKTFDECFDAWTSDTSDISERCAARWAYLYNGQVVLFWIERVSEQSIEITVELKPEKP